MVYDTLAKKNDLHLQSYRILLKSSSRFCQSLVSRYFSDFTMTFIFELTLINYGVAPRR